MNPSWPWWGARSREEAEGGGGSGLRLHTCWMLRNCCASCGDVHVPCTWTHVWCCATTASGMFTFLALAHMPVALIPCCWNREPVGTFKKVTSWRNFSRKHIPASNMCSCATNVITSHPTPPHHKILHLAMGSLTRPSAKISRKFYTRPMDPVGLLYLRSRIGKCEKPFCAMFLLLFLHVWNMFGVC